MSRGSASERRSQEERRGEAERRLLEAAAEAVAELGPSQITLATVGERAGYSRGLVTHHFGSKGAMMERLVGTVSEQFREEILGKTGSGIEALRGFLDIYFTVVADLPPINRARLVLWADAVATPSERRAIVLASDREFREELTERITQGQRAGEFAAEVDPRGLAITVVGVLRGIALQSMLDPELDLAAGRRELEQMLFARLAPQHISDPHNEGQQR
ncbi:TetR/AcrR family transcriptional regulator [Nocardia sp. NBC_01327]|uniref:TetR/AcrR family transcriptional regulator n=1 Tax=Nocardia sp. NBC_01327 TaxID=2903593 RepID=UPI002E10CFB1|nr:TetR/AcrR family transcriptional regulator [Nocardia sp. NBC_01327]